MISFGVLARKYDLFNSADTESYVRFIEKAFETADIAVKEVLDAGCGTGVITLALAADGYDMIGADISEEMLGMLRQKDGSDKVLILNQDMRSLDLYGTVQATVSTYDCLNYLGGVSDLRAAFSSVALFTEPGGVFIFDINTKYAYECIYGDNCYVYESDDDMLIWQNYYSRSSKKCRFGLTLFEKNGQNYIRSDEEQVQRYFPDRTVKSLLDECGFDVVSVYGGTDFSALEANSPKAYYICKRRNK